MSASLEKYRDTLHRRAEQRRRNEIIRRRQARRAASRVARLLRESYGASRVVLFGSMAREEGALGPRSDIDLAVWGFSGGSYYEAVARAQEEASPFKVDLIRMERSSPSMQASVRREGVEI